ncbi:MAG TPA: aldo/keto reductase [Sporichthyaceae bacterium]|nr:aldo/keto reductase [Sporichthyaceae bacterium]
MVAQAPVVTLNNGTTMPALGLGVFQSAPEETAQAVEAALAHGYRLIDTAAAYRNERQVGAAIAAAGLPRAELFVTTKLWMTDYGYATALRAFDASLRRLGLDHVDLYLLHWPAPAEFDSTVAAYQAAEQVLAQGRARAIGVCNFTAEHLLQLMARTDVVPAVNQVELHPFFNQHELRDAHRRLRITTQSWSPIGGVHRRRAASPDQVFGPLEHPTVVALAAERGRTPAQIVLRWHLQQGLSAIPKSVRPQRIAENFDVFDFGLSDHEMAAIDALDTGSRTGADPDTVGSRTYDLRPPEDD